MSPDDDLNPPFLLTMASDNDDDPNPISCSLEQAMNNSPFSGLIERNSFHYVPHESLSSTHMTPKNPRICSSFEDDAASKADSQPFNVFHSPNGTKLWCPIVDLSLKPTEGMIFQKWDDVVSFYDVYAENAGFSVRRSTVKKVQGVITHRYLLCNWAGRPQSKRKFDSLDVNSLYVRQSTFKVTDCKACLKVKAMQGSSMFKVYSFIEPHNHVLVSSFNKDLMKKGRQLDFSSKQFIHNMSLNRIGPMVAHRIQVTLKGGHHNVSGTPDDYNNWSKQLKYFIGDRDSKLLVEKLQSRADHLTKFSFHFVLSNGELRSLFWADDISKLNYKAFGDVLAFDATYQTNRYNMIFVPFTGVDHHNRCVTFGAGLLCNETIESYKWLLECFLKVHGKQPLLVLTDQDPAMRQAVPMVFDKSRHRLCMWHIMKKLPAKGLNPNQDLPRQNSINSPSNQRYLMLYNQEINLGHA